MQSPTVAATSIPIDSAVRNRLRSFGIAGMNYSEIVTSVLDRIEREAFLEELQREVDDPNTKWIDHKDIEWD